MKFASAVTLLCDVGVLALLALLPFAHTFGWSDAVVTPAAFGGMLYLGVPLCLDVTAIGAYLKRGIPEGGSVLASTAFWASVFVAGLAGWMALQTTFGEPNRAMRGFALITIALFLLNALVLRRPAFVPRVPDTAI